MGMLSEHSKLCSCKWRTLTQSDLANSLVVRVENVTNYLLVCWHLAKIMNTVNTSCLLYLGLEVHKKGNDKGPIQSNSTSCPKHQTGKGHSQSRRHQNKNSTSETSRGQLFRRPKSIRTVREKKSRAYDELLQVKWLKEVEPLLYFLIELIRNPNFYRIEIFASNFHQSSSNISSQYVLGFTFVDSFSAEIYKFDSTSYFVPYHWYTGMSGKFNTY